MSTEDRAVQSGKRGGYRPERPIEIGRPLFQWPPQPLAILKWLFGFPGFLWPWMTLFVALAALSWLYLTPDAEQMKSFSADWIAWLFVRNLALLVAFVSVWHIPLFVRKTQGTEFKYNDKWLSTGNSAFLFRSQLWDNVFWSISSGVTIWTAYEALTYWLQANGYVPTVAWQAHPAYCVLLILLTPFWINLHFYAIHRLLHWRPLYGAAHYLHHRNVNIGPWSGLAMHPIEHLLFFSGVLLYWAIPAHPLHVLFVLQTYALGPVMDHHGFDRVLWGGKHSFHTGHYMHYLHHKYVVVNYGTELVPLDRWFGSFHDGSGAAQEAMKRRARDRAQRPAGESNV